MKTRETQQPPNILTEHRKLGPNIVYYRYTPIPKGTELEGLVVETIATHTHQQPTSKEVKQLKQFLKKPNIALVEGFQDSRSDAQHIIQLLNLDPETVSDPFLDPLSQVAFSLFRDEYIRPMYQPNQIETSTIYSAARFVRTWLIYAKQHKISPKDLDPYFQSIFRTFLSGDYLEIVTPILQKMKEKQRDRYATEAIQDFQGLMHLVNQKTAQKMALFFQNSRHTNHLVYCGANHLDAILQAINIATN